MMCVHGREGGWGCCHCAVCATPALVGTCAHGNPLSSICGRCGEAASRRAQCIWEAERAVIEAAEEMLDLWGQGFSPTYPAFVGPSPADKVAAAVRALRDARSGK